MLSVVISLCGMLCVGGCIPAAWAAESKERNYQVVTCEEVEKLDPRKTSDPWGTNSPYRTHGVIVMHYMKVVGNEKEWLSKLQEKLSWSPIYYYEGGSLKMTLEEQRKAYFSILPQRHLKLFAMNIFSGVTTFLVPIFDFDVLRAYAAIEGFEQAKKAYLQKRNDVDGFRWARKYHMEKYHSFEKWDQQVDKVMANLTLQFCVPKDGEKRLSSCLNRLQKILPTLGKIDSESGKLEEFDKVFGASKLSEEGKEKSSE